MSYTKYNEYPSLLKPGIYPDGTADQLGIGPDVDLEKFSLGNWNSISKSNRMFFLSFQDEATFIEDVYEFETYLGRPVRVRFVDNGPVLTWTLLRRNGGFTVDPGQTGDNGVEGDIGDTIDGGYDSDIIEQDYDESFVGHIPTQQWYSPSTDWSEGIHPSDISTTARVGPLMPLSRFVDNYESGDVKKMMKFYRNFHNTYKRSDEETHVFTNWIQNTTDGPDNFSLRVREEIVEIFEEKYIQLKNIIDGSTGYIKELDPEASEAALDWDPSQMFGIPIQLTFKTDIQSQIDEILSFNIEVYGDGRGMYIRDGDLVSYPGKTVRALDTTRMLGHWYHRFKLYFGAYSFNDDLLPMKGYSTRDDVGRQVDVAWNSPMVDVTETYLPEDSYVLPGEPPIEYWGGIYLEKLTDDDSIIKMGDAGEYGFSSPKTGFTNMGRFGGWMDRFYFRFTYDALLDFMGGLSGTMYGLESGQSGRTVLEERLLSIGHPFYTFNYIEYINIGGAEQTEVIDELDYEVRSTPENSDIDFLYYDTGYEYNQTSYPIKTKLTMRLYGMDFNENPYVLGGYTVLDQIYLGQYNPLETGNSVPEEGIYRYLVIQWGDEKNLLTDEMILNSAYFYLYTSEEVPTPDNFHYKRMVNNSFSQLNFTVDSFHVYNTPGVKTLKIIVYRYDSTGNILLQTTLVTKNININDGTALSQDFEIFGGTDFNFLPLKDREAIIGGLDENSKYSKSVGKIAKDAVYTKDDFLQRKTILDSIEKVTSGEYGKSPGHVDLSTIRIFKGTSDIYDFLMTDDQKDKVISNKFPNFSGSFYGEDDIVKFNSETTDIFINDGDSELKQNCMIEINPQKMEYLTIPNTVGNKDKGILIGDFEVKKEKNQPIRKDGIMQTPLLEDWSEEQAF